MAAISFIYAAFVVLIAGVVWRYVRFIGPYLKLPCSVAIIFDCIGLFICSLVKRKYAKKNLLQKVEEVCRKYEKEGLFVTWLSQPVVFIFNQGFVKKILNDPAATYKPKIYFAVERFFGNSIALSNGEKFKRQTKIVKQAFQFALREKKIQIVNKYSRNLVETLSSLPSNTTNDILNVMRHSGIQIIIESTFGTEIEFKDQSLILETLHRITTLTVERFFKPWMYPDFSFLIFPEGRKCLKGYKTTYGMLLEMIEKLKENMPKNNLSDMKPGLVGEVLLKKHLEDPSFTMDELMGEIVFMFVAAFDTTAITMMWCLHLLGLHEEVQERILLEVEDFNEDLCDEDLHKMEYTDCVLRETLRMYTTLPIIFKYLTEDVQCGKYTIPKGSTAVLPLYVLHKNSDIFPDPEKFYPERFKKRKGGRQLYTASFADGLRPCLGKADALNQLKIMLAYIIRNFKIISLDKQKDVEVSYNVLIEAEKPLRIQFIPRREIIE